MGTSGDIHTYIDTHAYRKFTHTLTHAHERIHRQMYSHNTPIHSCTHTIHTHKYIHTQMHAHNTPINTYTHIQYTQIATYIKACIYIHSYIYTYMHTTQ